MCPAGSPPPRSLPRDGRERENVSQRRAVSSPNVQLPRNRMPCCGGSLLGSPSLEPDEEEYPTAPCTLILAPACA